MSSTTAKIEYTQIKEVEKSARGKNGDSIKVNVRGIVEAVLPSGREMNVLLSEIKQKNGNSDQSRRVVVRYLLRQDNLNYARFNTLKKLHPGDAIDFLDCTIRLPLTTQYDAELTASQYLLNPILDK